MRSKVMQTDDTPVAVLDPELPRTGTGRIWTDVGDDTRPYAGYDRLYKDPERSVVEVACWAHARRKFYESQSSDVMRSTVLLAYIRLLYDVEREARDSELSAEDRRALRQSNSRPILDDIRTCLETERNRTGIGTRNRDI